MTWACNVYSYASSVKEVSGPPIVGRKNTWACVVYSYTSSVSKRRVRQKTSEFLVCRYFRSRATKVRKMQCLSIYLVCDTTDSLGAILDTSRPRRQFKGTSQRLSRGRKAPVPSLCRVSRWNRLPNQIMPWSYLSSDPKCSGDSGG